MLIQVFRAKKTETVTMGVMLVDGSFFGYTLEDPIRDTKIKDETAIPAGRYKVSVTYSPHFKRDMCLIENVPNFEGIRIHGGNTTSDTSGCILVAKTKFAEKIQGSLEAPITSMVKQVGGAWIEIV